ncbi:hypothetical protein HAZT_HAZT011887 [Hyalella azteca]|uniref:Fibronectin type-III domain-containing protein n=1 Tax=Hyalella azteca TaxID=294128 RepID=A0A6A0GRH6_HYAAZ|nr:hypothetical protein HAZT_HAZT011887 [Hyalella azteca]
MALISIFILTLSSHLAAPQLSEEALTSLGCFHLPQDNANNHTLKYTVDGTVTGARSCVIACHQNQYRYAGVVAGNKCMCGLTFRGEASDDCSECINDSQNMCGGSKAVSVYETGGSVPGAPTNLKVLNSSSAGLYISWDAPLSDGSSEILQYEVTASPLETLSGLEPPIVRTWELGTDITSAWLYGIQSATHYAIEVRAANTAGLSMPATTEGWTSIAPPPIPTQPEMLSRTPETINVKLHTVSPTGGPITAYQVVVVDETVGAIMNPSALTNYQNASEQQLPYYIAAQFSADEFPTVFTVGDKKTYGNYYNAPLKTNVDYHILLGVISTMNKTLKSYSASDHGQHSGSEFGGETGNPFATHPESAHSVVHGRDMHHEQPGQVHAVRHNGGLVLGLSISVAVLGCLVLIAVVIYIALRVYLRSPRRPDNQK